jgi:hypothetical protein
MKTGQARYTGVGGESKYNRSSHSANVLGTLKRDQKKSLGNEKTKP